MISVKIVLAATSADGSSIGRLLLRLAGGIGLDGRVMAPPLFLHNIQGHDHVAYDDRRDQSAEWQLPQDVHASGIHRLGEINVDLAG